MKYKHLLGLVFVIFITLVLVFGCESSPSRTSSSRDTSSSQDTPNQTTMSPSSDLSPFTIGILNRLLNEAENFNINQCQFFLSGRITLERRDEEENQRVDNGTAVFIDNNNRREITINDRTEGIALRMVENRGEINLYICFDQDDRYQLVFSAAGGENSQFFLDFNAQNDPHSDARGNLEYGGQDYRLIFSGGIPNLMIKLVERREEMRDSREALGRRLNPAAFESRVTLTTDIMSRMKRSVNFSIDQYQLFLSGAIVLERFEEQRNVRVSDGMVIFEDSPTIRLITINDRTEGLALRIVENRDETAIYVSFEQDDRYQLVFSAYGRDTLFYLKSNPFNDPLSDARGSLEYGGQNYRLRFTGGRPNLQISLRREGGDTVDQHIAPGRSIR